MRVLKPTKVGFSFFRGYKMKKIIPNTLLLSFMAFSLFSLANAANYRVQEILDGDTIRINNAPGIIRLSYIDAPEIGQKQGSRSARNLEKLIKGKQISFKTTHTDLYGRVNAIVFSDGENINLTQISDGYAWTTARFSKNEYLMAEQSAKKYKKGLWNEIHIAPWMFRDAISELNVND